MPAGLHGLPPGYPAQVSDSEQAVARLLMQAHDPAATDHGSTGPFLQPLPPPQHDERLARVVSWRGEYVCPCGTRRFMQHACATCGYGPVCRWALGVAWAWLCLMWALCSRGAVKELLSWRARNPGDPD